MRVWATHAWPLFITPASTICGMIVERSAPSRMMAADLPPSSRVTGRRRAPAAAAMLRPAALDPVKVTLSTPGWVTR
jgi:hypothetical protein